MIYKDSEVSAFDAKTHLSELLRETEAGRSFTIKRRGKAIAKLVPVESFKKKINYADVARGFNEIRKRASGFGKIKQLIEEGRRF